MSRATPRHHKKTTAVCVTMSLFGASGEGVPRFENGKYGVPCLMNCKSPNSKVVMCGMHAPFFFRLTPELQSSIRDLTKEEKGFDAAKHGALYNALSKAAREQIGAFEAAKQSNMVYKAALETSEISAKSAYVIEQQKSVVEAFTGETRIL